jgi:predicted tellurium resistance membrane protein TerC
MERFPFLIYIGADVLALTAGKMLLAENIIAPFFEENPAIKWVIISVIITGVLISGRFKKEKEKEKQSTTISA